jgi:hypothetical protein
MKNEYSVKGDVVEILIRRKNGQKLTALIDYSDLPLAMTRTWCAADCGKSGGIYVQSGADGGRGFGKVYMHRFLCNAPDGYDVDHDNHNTLDNRRSVNLKVVPHEINLFNRVEIQRGNTSGHRGVFFSRRRNKWEVKIKFRKKEYRLGAFELKEDAVATAKSFIASAKSGELK